MFTLAMSRIHLSSFQNFFDENECFLSLLACYNCIYIMNMKGLYSSLGLELAERDYPLTGFFDLKSTIVVISIPINLVKYLNH